MTQTPTSSNHQPSPTTMEADGHQELSTSSKDIHLAATPHIIGDDEMVTSHVIGDNDFMDRQPTPKNEHLSGASTTETDHTATAQCGITENNNGSSSTLTETHVISHQVQSDTRDMPTSHEQDETAETDSAFIEPDFDILNQIPNMYKLLDIINDGVDKAVIHHESIRRITTKLQPGSYSSMSKIDFQKLDGSTISPMGVFGSRSKIVAWLLESGFINNNIASQIAAHQSAIAGSWGLNPGVYLLEAPAPMFYVIFWPEETTWEATDTTDAGKNRVLFIRYLTKLCDQIMCLVSDEDEAKIAEALSWNKDAITEPAPSTRLFKRKVTLNVEVDENATSETGNTYRLTLPPPEKLRDITTHSRAFDRFVGGNETQGVLVSGLQEYSKTSGSFHDKPIHHITRLLDKRQEPSHNVRLYEDIDAKSMESLVACGLVYYFSDIHRAWKVGYELALTMLARTQELERHKLNMLISHCMPKIHARLAQLACSELQNRYPVLSTGNWNDDYTGAGQDKPFDVPQGDADGFLEEIFSMGGSIAEIVNHFHSFDWDGRAQAGHDGYGVLGGSSQRNMHHSGNSNSPPAVPIIRRFSTLLMSPVRAVLGIKPTEPQNDPQRSPKTVEAFYLNNKVHHEASYSDTISDPCEVTKSMLVLAVKQAADILIGMRWRHFDDQATRRIQQEQDTKWKGLATQINAELAQWGNKSETVVIHGVVTRGSQTLIKCQKSTTLPQKSILTLHELSLGNDRDVRLRRLGLIEWSESEPLMHIQFISQHHFVTITNTKTHIVAKIIAWDIKYRSHVPLSVLKERLGDSFLFHFDEQSKRLAFVTKEDAAPRLWVHESDGQKFISMPPIFLEGFPFATQGEFLYIRFLPGGKNMVFVDSKGQMALYSITSEQFRSSRITLDTVPFSVECTPDGSCIFVGIYDAVGKALVKAFHVASFGQRLNGFDLEPHLKMVGDSLAFAKVGHSQHVHLVSLQEDTLYSQVLHITSRSADYFFRSSGVSEGPVSMAKASLIHCFTEVWTRYPIIAAIDSQCHRAEVKSQPNRVLFVTTQNHGLFVKEFAKQVKDFERKHHKPTGNRLSNLDVKATSKFGDASECSEFPFGDWLASLFCLIPIHVAITRANQFIPLKDGSISAAFDDSTSGVEVEQLANSLSFGWYESIFASYYAKKPVRVVSSMGEQSVGKSYALNHLAGTSFAGSAMRCTEGAWLSVTPCAEELLVALDFEGINSIERSKQEDMLLVLFQTAISNLVMLRSHSAMSRNLNKLLSSFQRSAATFNPEANPTLFRSTLALIIRDVSEADANGTVVEFDTKLDRIVKDEQDGNFITRLHRGEVAIIPWPLMSSSAFYHTFEDIKGLLYDCPAAYSSGGEFLGIFKMLMAQIQACDWSAVENSLGAQRARLLETYLSDAFRYGKTGLSDKGLVILDTDELLSDPSHEHAVFGLSSESPDHSFAALRTLCKGSSIYHQRHQMSEDDFVRNLGTYLQQLAEKRISLVENWISQNTSRFQKCPDVQELYALFKSYAQLVRSQVIICGMGCERCGRRCMNIQRHLGEHSCDTDHSCSNLCSFSDEDTDPNPRYPVEDYHSCDESKHLCHEPCRLKGRANCHEICMKPANHPGNDHICDTRKHTCGQICDLASLQLQDPGASVCRGRCDVEYDQLHEHHRCERLGCPFQCRLCGRLCGEPDHLHGLQQDSIHLCGDEHRCDQKCEMPGVCEVKSQPYSVEETYNGQLETFQYTMYTQQARKLHCAVPIPANKLTHDGLHEHSRELHYCEARCPQCDYYCILPLGHSEQEHETSHGNMKNTKWLMEADQAIISGRRYATGDHGVTMLCSVVCSELGRHPHRASCKAPLGRCSGGDDVEHISEELPTEGSPFGFDWISHRLFWERSGFKDPYSKEQLAEFSKCQHQCNGEEHKGKEPSLCILPLFHQPANKSSMVPGQYVSRGGHIFNCEDPSHPPCHIILAIDRSTSMRRKDRTPQSHFPGIPPIAQIHNNRYGAVLVALYRFFHAIQTARRSQAATTRDAFSCVLFDSDTTVPFVHDETSSNEELVTILAEASTSLGTNFNNALDEVKSVMVENWSTMRLPVVIFLSDGEDKVDPDKMRDLCQSAVTLGKPLAFYSISFGKDYYSGTLQLMARTAQEVYRATMINATKVPCIYHNALDAVHLEDIFLDIAESVRSQRAVLIPK